MTPQERLRSWADAIEAYGPDLGQWIKPSDLIKEMRQMADEVEHATPPAPVIKDSKLYVGSPVEPPKPQPESFTGLETGSTTRWENKPIETAKPDAHAEVKAESKPAETHKSKPTVTHSNKKGKHS